MAEKKQDGIAEREVNRPGIFAPDPHVGLTSKMADERMICGLDNREIEPPTKTVKQIILSNTLTYFNLVFTVLALGICIAGSWRNLTFMGVVIANTLIGIFQELKSKKTLDKMALLTSQKCIVIRDGKEIKLDTHKTVRDDIAVFSAGSQIYADAVVVEGECIANEALITGEADEIRKKPGDELFSGSYLMEGRIVYHLTRVGEASYASRLVKQAKAIKPPKSVLMTDLNKLVRLVSILLCPLGLLLFLKQYFLTHAPLETAIPTTVASSAPGSV